MKLNRWLLLFLAVCVICAGCFALFNVLVDPFGVFGDPLLDWYSYNMTENPRVAKAAYLEEHHGEYDSYIIGSSKSASIPVEALNDYLDASFYNMTWYGGNLWHEYDMIRYLLEHYEVRNMVLTLDPAIAVEGPFQTRDLKQRMHARVDGSSLLDFYASYLFCNGTYGTDKLAAWLNQGYLQSPDAVYLAETGMYNKQRRDAGPIHDLETYLTTEAGPFTTETRGTALPYIDESMELLRDIVDRCNAAGVNLIVVWHPLSDQDLLSYDQADVERLLVEVSRITDSWNFLGFGSVQTDPRYYYDFQHYRNCVGEMMAARIFGDDSIYVPEDFGVYDTAQTMEARLPELFARSETAAAAEVPILLYHAFVETAAEVTGNTMVTTETFEAHLKALTEAGYETVTLAALEDYVYHGTPLPEKPIVLVADDGYTSNLTLAAPLLEQYGACMSVAAIGCSVGKDTYKDTGEAMFPHFGLEEALPWVEAGVIEVISHTYDMHQVPERDGEDCRISVHPRKGEDEAEYVAALTADLTHSRQQLEEGLHRPVTALAYPNGEYTEIAEIVAHTLGFRITMTIEKGTNQLVPGLPQSLYQLRRNWITDDMTGQDLLDLLRNLETEE